MQTGRILAIVTRRATTLTAAVAIFAGITAARFFVIDGSDVPFSFLYVVPIALIGMEFGLRWGLATALLAAATFVGWVLIEDPNLTSVEVVVRTLVLAIAGVTTGEIGHRRGVEGAESARWFEMSNVLHAQASFEGYFTRLNAEWSALLGWTEEELMAKPFLEFVHPDDSDPTVKATEGLAAGNNELIDFENRYRAKDGSYYWLSWGARSDGERIYATARDITRSKELEAERDELLARSEAMARTDALTGLPNRRAWDEELRRELARADRYEYRVSLAIVDLDRFKRFNDTRGHQAGDDLLCEAAQAWRLTLRVTDLIARIGGEEFAVLLPHCPPTDATTVIERMRAVTPQDQTCSAGVAVWDGSETGEALTERADSALYEAKRGGRDAIVSADVTGASGPS